MYPIIRRLGALVATLIIVIAVTSCAESSRPVATGKGNIRGINAVVTSPQAAFLNEERLIGSVNFKQNSDYRTFDNLNYNFNFDASLSGEVQLSRLTTQNIDVETNREYTVVLTGTIANPSSLFWDDPIREWDGSETVTEIVFAHLAPSVDEVDIYFAAPGTVPVRSEKIGTLTNGNRLAVVEFEEDEYEMIVTPKSDPGTFIYQSAEVTLAAQTRILFAIFDGDPTLPGNIAVNRILDSGLSADLPDVNFPPQLRTLHTALGTDNFDGYFESDFGNKIYSDVGFQDLAPYADVLKTNSLLTLTQVGNIGAIIHEEEVRAGPNTKGTVVLTGEPGDLSFYTLVDSTRPIETFASARFVNTSVNSEALDIYVLEPGTPIDDEPLPRIRAIPSNADTGSIEFQAEKREVTITLTGEKTPISAPLILDLANGDVIDVVILDTVDPNIVELMVIENHSLP